MSSNNKKGFTIIEVVLVLAIAGLIFLMVFIALPALQSGQRNTQRENDISRFMTAVNDYQSNNKGKIPFTGTSTDNNFVLRYIKGGDANATDKFSDPDGSEYSFDVKGVQAGDKVDPFSLGTSVDHKIYVVTNSKCGDTEGTIAKGTGDRQITMRYIEEGGAILCQDNS